MMGPEKLSTIRAKLRKSFEMTDAELHAWFDRQIENRKQAPDGARAEVVTLELLRDALLEEVKRSVQEGVAVPEE